MSAINDVSGFLNYLQWSDPRDVPHLISCSLVNNKIFTACTAQNPIIHSKSFFAKFEGCDAELEGIIEVFRRKIVGALLIEGKGYKGMCTIPLNISDGRVECE